jgi:DNA modification methylase
VSRFASCLSGGAAGMTRHVLSSTAVLYHADMRDMLKERPDNSVDSVVCDPPYHLTSIVKRFGGANAAPAQYGTDGAFARASTGFMGRTWDGGDIAFRPETWAEVLRVLKPGGHVAAFGATRGYHRMTCAIEDAGFEIRDSLAWIFGTGFPKSHDVSKGIDKTSGVHVGWFGPWLKAWRTERGIAQKDIAALFPSKTGGKTGCVANWELGFNLPTPEQFNLICTTFGLPFDSLEAAEREVVGQRTTGIGTGGGSVAIMGDGTRDITAPSSTLAQEWEGWGTALKPAFEPIVLARKPLSEPTVAANVLKWRTGALNIDASRIHSGESTARVYTAKRTAPGATQNATGERHLEGVEYAGVSKEGRWPANVVTDGSDEVVGAFPQSVAGGQVRGTETSQSTDNAYGKYNKRSAVRHADGSGSAARFFYSAKASKADRNGSKHPTVKPIALMEWLVRLVTPPGGTVLDPFAGSGTTGIAATNRGFRVILCEREAEYVQDIRARFGGVDIAPLLRGLARAARIQALRA